MVNSLPFELNVLGRMSERYASITLQEIGLTEADAARIRQQCSLKLPEHLDSDVGAYVRLLGDPVRTEPLGKDIPEVFAGSTSNYFVLSLWPHLYWTVNTCPHGRSWDVGFRNQISFDFEQIDPAVIRVGLWTRSALEHLADHHELYDGWDERVAIRFDFGEHRYEGTFVLGLLQHWQKL
jgi:hypothetical protein